MANVTIIIVNYNSGVMLAECLRALLRQTYTELGVVVVDNASTDQSLDNLPQDARLQIIRNSENLGFAAANNQVGLQAKTPYIACLNPDTIPQPNWLKKLVDIAETQPQFAMFGSTQLDASDPRYADGLGDEYYAGGFAWRRGNGLTLPATLQNQEVFGPCAAAALYRAELFQSLNGFEERFFCYMEDVDFAFRARLTGARCLQVADAVVHHHGYAITGSRSDFMLYHSTRNMMWTYWRNMPLPLLFLSLPLHISCMLLVWVWGVKSGNAKTISRAIFDAKLGMLAVLKQRCTIQRQRGVPIASIAAMLLWNPVEIVRWRKRVRARIGRKQKGAA